jgi:hypothetical protein
MDENNISVNAGSDRATVVGDPTAEVPAKKGETKEEFVRRQAYEEVNKDMHKFKSRAKEAEAKAAEAEAKLKAIEEDRLKQEQKYQELYEREKKQREQEAIARKKDRDLYLRGLKLAALKAELGNVREEYLSHAAIDEIEVQENGSLSSDSVRSVANKFRQDHPSLIPQNVSGNITSYASPTSFNSTSKVKTIGEMSFQEKAAYLKQLKNQK